MTRRLSLTTEEIDNLYLTQVTSRTHTNYAQESKLETMIGGGE